MAIIKLTQKLNKNHFDLNVSTMKTQSQSSQKRKRTQERLRIKKLRSSRAQERKESLDEDELNSHLIPNGKI